MCLRCTKRRPCYLLNFYFTAFSYIKKKSFSKEKENILNFAVRNIMKGSLLSMFSLICNRYTFKFS